MSPFIITYKVIISKYNDNNNNNNNNNNGYLTNITKCP